MPLCSVNLAFCWVSSHCASKQSWSAHDAAPTARADSTHIRQPGFQRMLGPDFGAQAARPVPDRIVQTERRGGRRDRDRRQAGVRGGSGAGGRGGRGGRWDEGVGSLRVRVCKRRCLARPWSSTYHRRCCLVLSLPHLEPRTSRSRRQLDPTASGSTRKQAIDRSKACPALN